MVLTIKTEHAKDASASEISQPPNKTNVNDNNLAPNGVLYFWLYKAISSIGNTEIDKDTEKQFS